MDLAKEIALMESAKQIAQGFLFGLGFWLAGRLLDAIIHFIAGAHGSGL